MHPSLGTWKWSCLLPSNCPLCPSLCGHHHHPRLGTHPVSWTQVVFYLSPSLAALPASGRPCSPPWTPKHYFHRHNKLTDLRFMGASQVAPLVKKPTYKCRRRRRHGFDAWVREIPWGRTWQPSPVVLPGESHGQRSLASYSPRGPKESVMTEQLSVHTHTHMQCTDHDWVLD